MCIPERFFVHHTKHDELVEKLSKALSGFKIGSAMDEGSMFGPLSNQPHFHKVKHYLDMAKVNNQIIAGGGSRSDRVFCTADFNFL